MCSIALVSQVVCGLIVTHILQSDRAASLVRLSRCTVLSCAAGFGPLGLTGLQCSVYRGHRAGHCSPMSSRFWFVFPGGPWASCVLIHHLCILFGELTYSGTLLIFWLGCLSFYYWAVRLFHIFCISHVHTHFLSRVPDPYENYDLQRFSPTLWVVASLSLRCLLRRTELFNFDEGHLTSIFLQLLILLVSSRMTWNYKLLFFQHLDSGRTSREQS